MLGCCGKRLLAFHDFFLMRSHGDTPVFTHLWCHVTRMHGYASASKQDLWKTSSFANIIIDIPSGFEKVTLFITITLLTPLLASSFRRLKTKLHFILNVRYNFSVQSLILVALIHYLLIPFIHTHIYLYYLFLLYIHTILFCTLLHLYIYICLIIPFVTPTQRLLNHGGLQHELPSFRWALLLEQLVPKMTQGSIYWSDITSVFTELRWKSLTREHLLTQ